MFIWIGSSLEPGSVTIPVWVPCNKFGTLHSVLAGKVTSVTPMCLEGKCGLHFKVIPTLKCPDSYLEISLLQIKGHFCTDSSAPVTVTECVNLNCVSGKTCNRTAPGGCPQAEQ